MRPTSGREHRPRRPRGTSIVIRVTLVALVVVACPARADDAFDDVRRARAAGGPLVTLDWDNDAFQSSGRDGLYTNGTRLTFRLPSPTLHESTGADGVRRQHRHVYGARLGQNIYTPADTALPPERIEANDRPYAGYLFAGLFRDTYSSAGAGGRYLRLGLDVGCIGPCSGAEHAQRAVHRYIDAQTPQGWSAQIRNEFIVQSRAEYAPGRVVLAPWADLQPYAVAALGNAFIGAGVGATVRAGRFNSPFAGSVVNAPSREGLDASGRRDPDRPDRYRTEAFVFGRVETRWIGYNATLQGGWFTDSPRTVNAEPFVVETEIGAALAWRRFSIAYSVLTRSPEVSGQPFAMVGQRWGRFQVGWQFD